MAKKLHVGLVMQGGAGWIGGSEYIRNLVEALYGLGRERVEVSLIRGRALEGGFQGLVEKLQASIELPPVKRGMLRRFVGGGTNNARMARAVRDHGIDFVYPLTYDNLYNIGVELPLGAALGRTPWAGWIPDFQHKHLPHLFDAREIAKRDRGIALLAREAKTMVFSSEAARKDFEFCPESEARAEVLHFCTSPQEGWFAADPEAVRKRYHLPERYFLVSNQLWLHKNHLKLVEALGVLARRGVRPQMVWTGQPGDFRDKSYLNTVLGAMHEAGIAQQIAMLGLIAREDQIQLMRGALAVVQPSLSEGWSTVLEDARALGKAVIASDLAVHVEQNPPGAQFFPRDSGEALAGMLAEGWEKLQPGPDLERENAARAAAKVAKAKFGERLVEIAMGAVR